MQSNSTNQLPIDMVHCDSLRHRTGWSSICAWSALAWWLLRTLRNFIANPHHSPHRLRSRQNNFTVHPNLYPPSTRQVILTYSTDGYVDVPLNHTIRRRSSLALHVLLSVRTPGQNTGSRMMANNRHCTTDSPRRLQGFGIERRVK